MSGGRVGACQTSIAKGRIRRVRPSSLEDGADYRHEYDCRFTLLSETAKANQLEPYAYLRSVFTELPQATSVEAIDKLLPAPTTTEDLADVSCQSARRRKTCR
jgi:IS66 C-terminal element